MASTITTSVVTGGVNAHATTAVEVNGSRSDWASPGVIGTTTSTSGQAPSTGSFAVNAQSPPAMFVDVSAGTAYITATPSGQSSQILRALMSATYTSYAISVNVSGSTKYDWIYLQVDATKANNPASDASDVTALYTSRSSSNTTDNGSPPTYGILLAIVTVANGASSIANSNIADSRTNASWSTATTTTTFYNFIESGCIWSGDSYASTLNASMSSGIVWISGKRLRVPTVSGRSFTASKDTYVNLSDNGDGTAAFTYTTANNNAASPSLASGAVRLAIIVTGGTSIAAASSINQGSPTCVLPIASSIPYVTTDSLGNLISPRDPARMVLGYTEKSSGQGGITTIADLTGLSITIIIPANCYSIVLQTEATISSATAGTTATLSITDSSNVVLVERSDIIVASNSAALQFIGAQRKIPVTPGNTYTYKLRAAGGNAVTINNGDSTNKPTILIARRT